MLTRFFGGSEYEALALSMYRRFHVEKLVEHDIGAEETYNLLLKLPLVVYNHKFFPLNVRKKLYQMVSLHFD